MYLKNVLYIAYNQYLFPLKSSGIKDYVGSYDLIFALKKSYAIMWKNANIRLLYSI